MNDFYNEAIGYILKVEGIYSDNPYDVGGETYGGISRRAHPDWEGWTLIDKAKSDGIDLKKRFISINGISILDLIKYFYKKNYWDALNLDKIDNKQVCIKIFDMGVNMGIKRASVMLQTCVKLCDKSGAQFLKVDGRIGEITIQAVNSCDSTLLLKLLTIYQANLYLQIISNHPSQREFLNGWINRLNINIGEFK